MPANCGAVVPSERAASLIHAGFLAAAVLHPEAIAIEHQGRCCSYTELERRSRAIASDLRSRGVGPGACVAILAERGPALVSTILAVLRAGAVFVVLDSAYPPARLATLVSLSRARLIVGAGTARLHEILQDLGSATGVPTLEPGDHASGPQAPGGASVEVDTADPHAPAYYVFTSGSTGLPKAVACSHVPLARFVAWHRARFGFDPTDRFTMLSGLSHDPILRDIFTPLSIGATLVIPDQCSIVEPGALRDWLAHAGATVAHLTPALGRLLLAGTARSPSLPRLRRLFWGGDQLSFELVADVARVAPHALQTNFYGCSETPQAAAWFTIGSTGGTGAVPVGRGTDGFTVSVVDHDKRPVSSGEVGEVAITSRFLGLGYVEDGHIVPFATSRGGADGARTYFTGDRGRILPDGHVVVLGRSDDQVKIRGFRVDLSEVTRALSDYPGVGSALALPLRRGPTDRIGAFVAVQAAESWMEEELLAFLSTRLPAYMLPHTILVFERTLPLLPNGKPDRRALQDAGEAALLRPAAPPEPSSGEDDEPAGSARDLVARWRRIFGDVPISGSTTFMSLGGDSLSYVEAYLALEEVVGTVPEGWPEMSIAELVAHTRPRSAFTTAIDSFMLLRAVSICLIVAYHFGLTTIGDGFTGALFVVSGFLFGGMPLKEAFRTGRVTSIAQSVRNIAIPTMAFALLYCLLDGLTGKAQSTLGHFLGANLIDYPRLAAHDMPVIRHQVLFWYVDTLIQILLVIFAVTLLLPRRKRTPRALNGTCAWLFAVACPVKFILPAFIQPGFLTGGAPDLSLAQISPIGNFATFMLGVVLAVATDRPPRALALLAMLFAIADAPLYGLINAISIGGAGLMLTCGPRVTVPRLVASIVFLVSGASLYIYLTHLLFGAALQKLIGNDWAAVATCLAVAGGVGVHFAWKGCVGWLGQSRQRLFQIGAAGRSSVKATGRP